MAKARNKKMIEPSHPPVQTGPYLAAALIAEKILREPDAATIVRVIDKIGISPETVKDIKDDMLGLPLTILLSFRSGGYIGKSELVLVQVGPSGNSMPCGLANLSFESTIDTKYMMSQVVLKWEYEGDYSFDVFLDHKLVSRIPLQIEFPRLSLAKHETGRS